VRGRRSEDWMMQEMDEREWNVRVEIVILCEGRVEYATVKHCEFIRGVPRFCKGWRCLIYIVEMEYLHRHRLMISKHYYCYFHAHLPPFTFCLASEKASNLSASLLTQLNVLRVARPVTNLSTIPPRIVFRMRRWHHSDIILYCPSSGRMYT